MHQAFSFEVDFIYLMMAMGDTAVILKIKEIEIFNQFVYDSSQPLTYSHYCKPLSCGLPNVSVYCDCQEVFYLQITNRLTA